MLGLKKIGNVIFVVTLIFTGSVVQARLRDVQTAAASNRIIVHPDKGQRARTPPPPAVAWVSAAAQAQHVKLVMRCCFVVIVI